MIHDTSAPWGCKFQPPHLQLMYILTHASPQSWLIYPKIWQICSILELPLSDSLGRQKGHFMPILGLIRRMAEAERSSSPGGLASVANRGVRGDNTRGGGRTANDAGGCGGRGPGAGERGNGAGAPPPAG